MILRANVPQQGFVRLGIYDVTGREVRRLVDGTLPAGLHQVEWAGFQADGTRMASGVYFCRLESGGETATRRVIYLAK
jgi:flagellar hook assembly protein FlgD